MDIASEEKFETAGGYAKKTSADYQKKQSEAINAQLPKTDILITTALIPGQEAPLLVSKEMLKSMPRGAVVVDMASESGGNVAGTKDMQEISADGIILIGNSNLATEIPASASALFAKNIYNFLLPMYQADKKKINFNFDDELVKGTVPLRKEKYYDGFYDTADHFSSGRFIGYFVVWGVTPGFALPLMSVSNAISGIVIVGALITAGVSYWDESKTLGLIAVVLASINIFGGFAVSHRMLLMFKKKDRKEKNNG